MEWLHEYALFLAIARIRDSAIQICEKSNGATSFMKIPCDMLTSDISYCLAR